MNMLLSYIYERRTKGKIFFTAEDVLRDTGMTYQVFQNYARLLRKKGELISPMQGLYISLTPENKIFGSIPAEELLPILMSYLHEDYYVCLLSAALYHGVSHQKPQKFQIMSTRQRSDINLGRVSIQFTCKKNLAKWPKDKVAVKTGYLEVASPETIMFDLFLHPHKAGGLNNIATMLPELIIKSEPHKIRDLLQSSREIQCVQRLGYILELIEIEDSQKKAEVLKVLKDHLKIHRMHYIPLEASLPADNSMRNASWKIIVNTNIESDDDT